MLQLDGTLDQWTRFSGTSGAGAEKNASLTPPTKAVGRIPSQDGTQSVGDVGKDLDVFLVKAEGQREGHLVDFLES